MSGTTTSVAFIRKGKLYLSHVGESSILLVYQDEGETRSHEPESEDEVIRIAQLGAKVVIKSG
jgi:protein phosphatase 1D